MPRPNLLFIFTDEQRADTMAAYGNPIIQTPNLNKLATESTVFERTYVTQPVCTPSRSSILTGLWPHTNGCTRNNLILNEDMPCLPEMLVQGHYETGYIGKWHLGDELFHQHGFDEWVSIEDMYNEHFSPRRDRGVRSSYHHYLQDQGFTPGKGDRFGRSEAAALPEQYGKPTFVGHETSRFIREHRDDPFCLYVNFLEPHMPFTGPRDGQYTPESITLPANFNAVPTEHQPIRARLNQRKHQEQGQAGHPLENESDWRALVARYWGLCSLVDTYVGMILRTLEECGLADNTIVVFTSDHGDMMSSHQMVAKTVMFEEAQRVPLLVRMPGQKTQQRVSRPVSQVDLVPTLMDLMDQPMPEHLEGESLAPLINGGDAPERDVFVEWNRPNRGATAELPPWSDEYGTPEEVRTALDEQVRCIIAPDGMKFNWSTCGLHELYDINSDPGETTNLMFEPDHENTARELAGRISRWQESTNDEVDLPTI
jgi:arylsulfatase A-like enzyme